MDTTNNLELEIKRNHRNMLIENGKIIDVTKTASKVGLGMKLAVTPAFFNHFFPYAEDATKGVLFEENLENILRLFKKESGGMIRNGMVFPVVSKTYVKKANGPNEIETFADGKPRDKYTTINVHFMSDENLNPSLLFGIEDYKFIGGE